MTEYMTIEEAAEYLRRSWISVRNYIKAGKLEGYQAVPKGRWLVTRASVEKFAKGVPYA